MSTVHKLKPVQRAADAPPAAAARTSGWRAWSAFVVREPFFQFMALGLIVWLGVEYINTQHNRYTIHITPEQRQRLLTTYQQQFSQAPTPAQLKTIMDRYVTEEIFVREGLALNLNENDEIVRRRIAQKFEFLQTDLAAPKEPSAAALKAWFSQNQSHYISAPSVSFTHVYFSADRDGDAAARARAAATLKTLRAEKRARAPQLGDSFPGPADVGSLTPDAAERLFGKSQLSEELFTLPPGQWAGPFQSGYGWHLVYVTDKKAPQLPSFDEVRAKVHDDYMDGERGRLNAATFEKLRSKYTVVYDGDGT